MPEAKIMLVEDEALLVAELLEVLQRSGYGVCSVVNAGEKVLPEIKRERPDLVLMDIHLKGEMDGIQTAEKIKEHYDIPIIFLTAQADDHFIERAKTTEPFGYLVKPIEVRELNATIEIALYKGRMESDRKELINQLQEALSTIKTLEGFIPICSGCKNIRNDQGYWKQIEEYFHDHSEARFTHSICPDCARKLYPELY